MECLQIADVKDWRQSQKVMIYEFIVKMKMDRLYNEDYFHFEGLKKGFKKIL